MPSPVWNPTAPKALHWYQPVMDELWRRPQPQVGQVFLRRCSRASRRRVMRFSRSGFMEFVGLRLVMSPIYHDGRPKG